MQKTTISCMLAAALWLAVPRAGHAAPDPQNINWAQVPAARLNITTIGTFTPRTLSLVRGQPVRLVFQNIGGVTRDFVTNFFQSVVQRPGSRPGGTRVILQPGSKAEYDIVPQTAGTYTVSSIMQVSPGAITPAQIMVK